MSIPFPSEQLESYYRQYIHSCIAPAAVQHLLIHFCHCKSSGEFELWGGFRATKPAIWQALADKLPPPPVLILGWHPREQLQEMMTTDSKLLDVLEWAGVAYFEYNVGKEVLDRDGLPGVIESILAGCSKPVPAKLLIKDYLGMLEFVRHCLKDNIKNNINGYINTFNNISLQNLNQIYFNPVEPISTDVQQNLDWLQALAHAVKQLVIDNSNLSNLPDMNELHIEVGNFISCWGDTEEQRKKLKSVKNQGVNSKKSKIMMTEMAGLFATSEKHLDCALRVIHKWIDFLKNNKGS